MSKLNDFISELKVRNVRKTLAIYLSTALTTIGIIKLFLDAYGLPAVIFPIVVTVLSFGLVSAFMFAWFHGIEGAQQFQKKEIAIHSLVALLALTICFRIGGATKPRMLSPNAKSIAVLPFKNMSDNKEDEYFSDGITEDILTQLSKIGDLSVVSRTSVMKYKDTDKNIREIADELGVGTILEGSVRRGGSRIRITGQLINAASDEHLWAETYDRELKDVFAIQMDVAQRIASSLKATLSPDELQRIEKKTTENLEAYSYYLRGREHYNRYTKDDNERAIILFKNALSADSSYALAYAGLGDAYAQRVIRYAQLRQSIDSALDASNRAVVLDADLAEAYKALGLAYEAQGHSRKALEQYYRAVKLNPNYAPVISNIAWVNNALGNYDEALFWMKKSVALNPGAARRYVYLGEMYGSLGEDSLAIHWCKKAIALQPELVEAYTQLTYQYLMQGEIPKADETAERALALNAEDIRVLEAAGFVDLIRLNYAQAKVHFQESVALSSLEEGASVALAYTLTKLGKQREAKQLLDSTLKIYAAAANEGAEVLSNPVLVSSVYSILNDTTQSIQWLRRAIDMGYRDYRWSSIDPLLERVRLTAEFTRIMTELKSRVDEMRKRAREREAHNT